MSSTWKSSRSTPSSWSAASKVDPCERRPGLRLPVPIFPAPTLPVYRQASRTAGAGLIGAGTRFVSRNRGRKSGGPSRKDGRAETEAKRRPTSNETPSRPTTAEALLAGLDAEKDLLTGWCHCSLTDNLPATWGCRGCRGLAGRTPRMRKSPNCGSGRGRVGGPGQ